MPFTPQQSIIQLPDDIACDTMNSKKLEELRQELASLRRRGGIRPNEMESFAKALGRKQDPRGKEPTWVNPDFPILRPVSIPHHKELNKYTAKSILDQLEEDIEGWDSIV